MFSSINNQPELSNLNHLLMPHPKHPPQQKLNLFVELFHSLLSLDDESNMALAKSMIIYFKFMS